MNGSHFSAASLSFDKNFLPSSASLPAPSQGHADIRDIRDSDSASSQHEAWGQLGQLLQVCSQFKQLSLCNLIFERLKHFIYEHLGLPSYLLFCAFCKLKAFLMTFWSPLSHKQNCTMHRRLSAVHLTLQKDRD